MYQMKVDGIKHIMNAELENKMNSIINKTGFHSSLLNSLKWDLLNKLHDCLSYDELEIFCSNYCDMSLNEWVESL